MKPDFSIVVPAYNESESIPLFVDAASQITPSFPFSCQYVFVDDGSVDDTFKKLLEVSIPSAEVKIVKLSANFGSHAAIRAGILHSDADRVMVYSMDMPEPIEDIARFYTELQAGWELVYSERIGYHGGFGSRVFAKLVNRFIEESYPAEGLVGIAFGPKIKEQLAINNERNSSVFFQVFQMGFARKSIPAHFIERAAGTSKWTLKKKMKLLIDCFVMFSFAPIRLISGVGIALAFLGIIAAIAIILLKIFNVIDFEAGYPTLAVLILVGFGITNISLGIVSEYLVRDLDATRGRPTFIVDEVISNGVRR